MREKTICAIWVAQDVNESPMSLRQGKGGVRMSGISKDRILLWVVGMRRALLCGVGGVLICLALAATVLAGGPDPADYPLRVHIFKFVSQSRHGRESRTMSDSPNYVDGQGVADLFENGEPRGFMFGYSCMDSLRTSGGYATFPARWKKKEKTLEVLLPEVGKPWNNVSCDLRAEMRPGLAFCLRNDEVAEESAAVFKEWMVKHQYDPEKGKDDPLAGDDGPMGPTEPQ
jgi:hypothetical protein